MYVFSQILFTYLLYVKIQKHLGLDKKKNEWKWRKIHFLMFKETFEMEIVGLAVVCVRILLKYNRSVEQSRFWVKQICCKPGWT